jgi:hypothetical protein
MAMQTSYTARGDHTAEEGAANWTGTTGSWFYLDAVTVRTTDRTGAVAALGDSITDGWQSTSGLDRRWPTTSPAVCSGPARMSRVSPTRESPATRSWPTGPGGAR